MGTGRSQYTQIAGLCFGVGSSWVTTTNAVYATITDLIFWNIHGSLTSNHTYMKKKNITEFSVLANVIHLVIFLLLIRSINPNTVRVIFQVSHQLSMQWVRKNCTPCGVSFKSYFSPCKLSFSYIQYGWPVFWNL